MLDLEKNLARVLLILSAICLIVMTAVISWQVFTRYLLGSSPPWAEPAALLLLIWFVLFAASAGVYECSHIEVGFFRDGMLARWSSALHRISDLLVAMFGIAMIYGGWMLIDVTRKHTIPGLGVTRAVAYWPLVFSGFAITFFSLVKIYNRQLRKG
jgi:TRAP-type C4-dicarboxylate transport system permease small subunit